jgi:hypothetical protein
MPRGRGLVDPRMVTRLQDFFTSTCSVWKLPSPRLQNKHGEVQRSWPADYAEYAGHRAIPCVLGVRKGDAGRFVEIRQAEATFTSDQLYVLLDGHYPLVEAEMVAVVDGQAYNIKGVAHQAQRLITSLAVELIR